MMFAHRPKMWKKDLKIVVHADNDEAIRRAQDKMDWHTTTKRTRGEHDIEAEIRCLANNVQIGKFKKAKGHQDEKKPEEEQERSGLINEKTNKQQKQDKKH